MFTADAGINAVLFVLQQGIEKLVVGTFNGSIHCYDVEEARFEGKHSIGKGDTVFCLAASASGDHLAVGGKLGKAKLYRYTTTADVTACEVAADVKSVLNCLAHFDAPGEIRSIALNDAATLLATGGDAKVVNLWGIDDHIKHATDLFIDFKAVFTRVLILLMNQD